MSLHEFGDFLTTSAKDQFTALTAVTKMSPSEIGSYVYNYFAPEPLSPLFQQGGIFYGYNEDLIFIVINFILLFIIDNIIVKPFIKAKVRYFFLHAVANGIVVVTSLPDMYRLFTVHPYDLLSGPCYTVFGNSATVALHLYHICFFKMSAEDWSHHLQFIPMCAAAPALKHKIGCMVAMSNFYLSGLVGGLEYVFLVLVEHKMMKKITEKRYFAWMNQWIRGPGAVSCAVAGYFSWRAGVLAHGSLHPAIAWTFGLFHIYNGMYFCQIAVESCARFEYKLKNKLIDENGKPIGTDLSPKEVEEKKKKSAWW